MRYFIKEALRIMSGHRRGMIGIIYFPLPHLQQQHFKFSSTMLID